MSERHLARARADLRKRLRRDLAFMSPLLLIAAAIAYFLVFDGWLHGQEGRMHRTEATVVEVGPVQDDGEVVLRFRFSDHQGRSREATQEYDAPPALAEGDVVPFMFGVGGRAIARPVSDGDRLVGRILLGLFAFVMLALIGLATYSVRRFLQRRFLLEHGRREAGQGARIEAMQVNFRNNTQPMWRLHMKFFDPQRAAWVECRSDWQSGTAPALAPDTELPPVLVDPRDARRHWLSTGDLAPDHFWVT